MRKLLCLLGFCFLTFSNVFGMNLTLMETVDKIVAESHDVKKAEANVKQAKAQLDAVNANRWFSIDASANYMNLIDIENPASGKINIPGDVGAMLGNIAQKAGINLGKFEIPDNVFTAGVSITQPIYTFGKIGRAVDAMHSAIDMSNSAKELTLREVKYAAANLYWTAKMTDEIVKIAEKTLKDSRTAKKNLTAVGRANRSNLIKIESDIASKKINLSDAKFNRETAYRMLKIMAGINLEEEIVLVDEMPSKFEELNVTELKSNPEWDIYNKQIQMYEESASSKRAGAYPTLAAMGSYNYYTFGSDAGHMFDKKGSQSTYWGLALQVPIFHGGLDKANATVDAMNAEAARQELDKSKKLKTEEFNTAVRQYKHLCDDLSDLNEANDLAQKAYDVSANRFSAGQTSAVELADVSMALYKINMALINSKYNILMAAESVKKLGE
ncbi:MAG: TolC family protein [Alphaproteobacteria bacterium]|nr:TolC family protein [Alphaproteobacteria bacterium]